MGFSRQEYWRGLPFPSAGDLPNPGVEPESPAFPALAGGLFTSAPPGKPCRHLAALLLIFLLDPAGLNQGVRGRSACGRAPPGGDRGKGAPWSPRTVDHDGEQTVEEGLQPLVPAGDDLMENLRGEQGFSHGVPAASSLGRGHITPRLPGPPLTYHDEQVGVGAGEDRDVHGHAHRVGLVQPHPEVPLPAQKQQDEDTDVHQAHPSCGAGRGRVTSLGGAGRKGAWGRDPSWGGGAGRSPSREVRAQGLSC